MKIIIRKSVMVSALFLVWLVFVSVGHPQQTNGDQASALFGTSQLQQEDAADFESYANGVTIDQVLNFPANKGKKSIIVTQTIEEETPPGHAEIGNRGEYLGNQVANSTAIVIGRPIAVHSALIKSRDFIFSDFEVEVDRVLKDATGTIKPGDTILITRIGGTLRINGVIVYAVDPDFPQLRLGTPHVFFLHKLANSPAFKVTANGAFKIQNGRVLAVRKSAKLFNKSKTDFLDDIEDEIQHTSISH